MMTLLWKKIAGGLKVIFVLTLILFIPLNSNAQAYQIKTIVIDAGHGGKDPGAIGRKGKEKDINLAVALLTGQYIEKYMPDVKVIYTRKTDEFIELHERANIANRNHADLFLSIHVNAVSNSRVTGASSWLLGVGKYQSNLELAKLENSVIEMEDNYEEVYQGFDPNKDESYIIFNFNSTKAYFDQSLNLAQEIQDQFKNRVGRRNYGIHQGPFLVLHRTTMPSVLIELGFITNPTEERFLMSQEGQEYMASAIFRSVRSYKQQIEAKNKKTVILANQNEPESTTSVAEDHGVTYKVQFLISKTELAPDDPAFNGLLAIWKYKDGAFYKYTTGSSSDLSDIKDIQNNIKDRYPDAFIAAFKDGERISISEAKRLINAKN
ncbi:N-acetylmuramoyl-L-alanine amidase [Saccharicrinis sp. FJH54]|uniref:N-acetylmuramoyl-L-alanine amidase family protein n=1 Tax=Saccharicrinis sp. FJH54 TaxID=3344665 RepID=UPI0035D3F6DC